MYKLGSIIGDYVFMNIDKRGHWVNFKTATVLPFGEVPNIARNVQKPDKVYVTRFVRPIRKGKGINNYFIDNLRGVTIFAELDYAEGIIRFNYSTCDGENFDKEYGAQLAKAKFKAGCPNYVISMKNNVISEYGLVADIWDEGQCFFNNRARRIFKDAHYE